jgi:hypothetical protein
VPQVETDVGGVVATYLCTISRESPNNWALCKQAGMWGIPLAAKVGYRRVEVGDHLLIWVGGRGYVAEAIVTDVPRSPRNRDEAPWPGGTYRFGLVVPMRVINEVQTPVRFPFVGDKQADTGLSKAMFRRSFVRLPDDVSATISSALAAQAREEKAPEGSKATIND